MKKVFLYFLLLYTIYVVFNLSYAYIDFYFGDEGYFEITDKNINNIIELNKGDILISKGALPFGISGHSAIMISDSEVLQIANPFSTTEIIAIDEYMQYNFGYAEVYKAINYEDGVEAAKWSVNAYENEVKRYFIDPFFWSTDLTYCSKIPYQAYKYGVEENDIKIPLDYGYIHPYRIKNLVDNVYFAGVYYIGGE